MENLPTFQGQVVGFLGDPHTTGERGETEKPLGVRQLSELLAAS